MDYCVTHQSYCGMTIPLGENYTHQEALDRAKRRIEWFKKSIGGEVTRLSRNKWELCEPENGMPVPDACGILIVQMTKERVIR